MDRDNIRNVKSKHWMRRLCPQAFEFVYGRSDRRRRRVDNLDPASVIDEEVEAGLAIAACGSNAVGGTERLSARDA